MKVNMKLFAVQQALKAPKDQFNSFGKYNYRSCEGILEAVKPHLGVNQLILTLGDRIVDVGGRVYVEATATVTDVEEGEQIWCTAYAREEDTKKGMDASQVTGAASSYARKYALNGLFAIDDNKDSDATNTNMKTLETVTAFKAETPESPKFVCEKCNAVLKPYMIDGKSYSIRQHAEGSRKKFGHLYCIDCINKMKGEQNA